MLNQIILFRAAMTRSGELGMRDDDKRAGQTPLRLAQSFGAGSTLAVIAAATGTVAAALIG